MRKGQETREERDVGAIGGYVDRAAPPAPVVESSNSRTVLSSSCSAPLNEGLMTWRMQRPASPPRVMGESVNANRRPAPSPFSSHCRRNPKFLGTFGEILKDPEMEFELAASPESLSSFVTV